MVSLESAKSHDLLNGQYKLSDADPSVSSGTSYATQDSGERKLAALGYNQELNRGFSTFTNFAVSFSIISILTGITGAHAQYHLGAIVLLHENYLYKCMHGRHAGQAPFLALLFSSDPAVIQKLV